MAKDWKERLGIVYSTNSDFKYDQEDQSEPDTLPANQQKLIVQLDKKNRKGKAVTLVTGFTGSSNDLEMLGKLLKTKCGVGGTTKDGEILIQGDFRDKVMQLLINEGYKVKRSGGL
jgi:translation initiation factor 1